MASVVTLLFQRLRLPVVLGYLLAGLIVGPHVPFPLFADITRIELLAELGVILVMFSIGLKFRIADLKKAIPTAGIAATVQIAGLLWLGYVLGQLIGWSVRESLFLGGMLCISSTMIVARFLEDGEHDARYKESAYGILVIQDLAVIVLIAVFTSIASGADLPTNELALLVAKLVGFMVVALVVGVLIVPPLTREANREQSSEVLLMTSIGICFGLALLAHELGYSVALGAFIGGSLIAESGRRKRVEKNIEPVRNLFVAMFFVSIGMLVDPHALAANWALILGLSALVVVAHLLLTSFGTFLSGRSIATSIQVGFTVGQIGEFGFVIVGIGVSAGAIPERMMAIAVGVAVTTTLSSSLLVRLAPRLSYAIERRLPRPIQTFASLYSSWLESLRASPRAEAEGKRRYLRIVIRDAIIIAIALVSLAFGRSYLAELVAERTGLSLQNAGLAVVGGAGLVLLPFAIGLARAVHKLVREVATSLLPKTSEVDLAEAPRRALTIAVEVTIALLVFFPLVAIGQPFFPTYVGAGLIIVIGLALGVMLWRNASNLDGHLRAGAELVFELVNKQRQSDEVEHAPDSFEKLLPGLGALEQVELAEDSPAVGNTLAELNVRALTGATVIAIVHTGGRGTSSPTGSETLEAGDSLVLTGSHRAVDAAKALLDRATTQDGAEGENE